MRTEVTCVAGEGQEGALVARERLRVVHPLAAEGVERLEPGAAGHGPLACRPREVHAEGRARELRADVGAGPAVRVAVAGGTPDEGVGRREQEHGEGEGVHGSGRMGGWVGQSASLRREG